MATIRTWNDRKGRLSNVIVGGKGERSIDLLGSILVLEIFAKG